MIKVEYAYGDSMCRLAQQRCMESFGRRLYNVMSSFGDDCLNCLYTLILPANWH